MRTRQLLVLSAAFSLAAVACGGGTTTPSAGGTTSPGASPPQPTANPTINDQGRLDASGMSGFSIELDDNYFKPTFIKARPGQALNIELENEGASAHTFTIASLSIDHEIAGGGKKEIVLTLPQGASDDLLFVCRFHASIGMQGGFYFGGTPTTAGVEAERDPY